MNEEIEKANWHYGSGKQFKEAFYILIADYDVFNNIWTKQIERPSYYCAGLAIEHFIKAYLLLENIIFPMKGSRGHDLNGLIDLNPLKFKEIFKLNDVDIKQISILNERYYNHTSYGRDDLRYASKSGTRISPHPDSLNRIINKMEKQLRDNILKKIK
jgi:hypothetical protein